MKYLSKTEAHDKYNDFLNEVYGTVSIAGLEYDTSEALKMVDEIAYRAGFGDWCDSEGITTDEDDVYLERDELYLAEDE